MPQVDLLVLQPTSFCNISCSYCYLHGRHKKRRMAFETLCQVGQKIIRSEYVGSRLTVVWHAGEPMTLPVSYYARAFDCLEASRPPGLLLQHSVQTNGTLLTEEWASFIREREVRIGVSVDGPRDLHDERRKTRSGHGTFDETMAGIRRLHEARIPFHVITVLSADSLRAPDRMFDFYVEKGIRQVCFNVEEIEGANQSSSLSSAAAPNAYAEFMKRFLRRLEASPAGLLWVREFSSIFGLILGPSSPKPGNQQTDPLAIVSIDADGNISTFSPELLGCPSEPFENFTFGNIEHDTLDDVLRHPAFRRLHAEIQAGVDRCAQTCAYFDYCGGGAPANKLFENGDLKSTETMYCLLTKKTLFDLALEHAENRLAETHPL